MLVSQPRHDAQSPPQLGIPPVTYQRIEARRAQIDAERLQELAEILGTTSGTSAAKLDVPPSH